MFAIAIAVQSGNWGWSPLSVECPPAHLVDGVEEHRGTPTVFMFWQIFISLSIHFIGSCYNFFCTHSIGWSYKFWPEYRLSFIFDTIPTQSLPRGVGLMRPCCHCHHVKIKLPSTSWLTPSSPNPHRDHLGMSESTPSQLRGNKKVHRSASSYTGYMFLHWTLLPW